MKTKSFFKHIGLAAGYLLFFMLLQGWVAALFSFGRFQRRESRC